MEINTSLTYHYQIRIYIYELLLDLAMTISDVLTEHNGSLNHNAKLHLKYPSGSGKWTRIVTRQHDAMIKLLCSHKICYALGNDAPRGGETGDYIEVSALDLCSLIQSLKNSVMLTLDQWNSLRLNDKREYIDSMYRLGAAASGNAKMLYKGLTDDDCDAIAKRVMHNPNEYKLYFSETNTNE